MKTIPWTTLPDRLDVRCPSAPWEGSTVETSKAYMLCYSLSVEYGYARILDDGLIIAEYTNGRAN